MIDVREYGRSLFELAEEEGVADAVALDVAVVKSVFADNPAYLKLLDTPALTKEERTGLIDSAFSGLNEYLINTLKLLAERHLAYCAADALRGFSEAFDQKRGIERVEAITAVPLSEEQKAALKEKLESKTGKTVIITNTIDAAILGGMKLRYCGKQLDGSVKTRLDGLEALLKQTLI